MTDPHGSPAAQRWASALAAWAIPEEILAAAPESPWDCPPALFCPPGPAEQPATPSFVRAREAIPPGGTVLDVGCGAGAASLPLVAPAALVVGVDVSAPMLSAFRAAAEERGVAVRAVAGRWPDVADEVAPADVVVCHHVLYNVADLPAFVTALDDHARRRVVIEITARHPLCATAHLWRHFWGLERPDGPSADDAAAVLRECGIEPQIERWERPPRRHAADRAALVAFTRRRLCLPPERDPEVDALLPTEPPPQPVVTMWWDARQPR
jgi:SAM-dependent methyltransferase